MSVRQNLRAKLASRRLDQICWSCSLRQFRCVSSLEQSGLCTLSCNKPDKSLTLGKASHQITKVQKKGVLIRKVSIANGQLPQSSYCSEEITPPSAEGSRIRRALQSQREHVGTLGQRYQVPVENFIEQFPSSPVEKSRRRTEIGLYTSDGPKKSTFALAKSSVSSGRAKAERLRIGLQRHVSGCYHTIESLDSNGWHERSGSEIYKRRYATAAVSLITSVLVAILTITSATFLPIRYSARSTRHRFQDTA